MAVGERTRVELGGNVFYIRSIPPFKSIKTLGDLQRLVSPIFSGIGKSFSNGSELDIEVLDEDLQSAEMIGRLMDGLFMSLYKYVDGDTLEKTFKLLLDPEYISMEVNGKSERLSEDLVNVTFEGNLLGMLELAYQVLRVNYADVFTTAVTRFGGLKKYLDPISNYQEN